MRALTRTLAPPLAAALLVLFAIACGSGDQAGSGQPADKTAGSGDLVSAAPIEVLSASAESFQQDVESLRMEMALTLNAGGFAVDADMNMAFRAPDQMHVTMEISGLGTFEMLMLGTDIYMNIPPQGWVVFSIDDLLGSLGGDGPSVDELGVDSESFQDTFTNHSFLDYQAVIESLGGEIEDLGEETVDGETYRHYRGSLDFADLTAAFSDAFSATDAIDLEDVSGPLTFDAWVDPDTLLPYKLTVNGEFAFGADAMVFDASMRFFGYNEPVEIPAPPEDAASLADFFAGLFE